MNRLFVGALALVATLALAACGDDDDSGDPSPTATGTVRASAARSPVPSSEPAADEPLEQLSYFGADGYLRIVNSDGTNDQALIEDPCIGFPGSAPSRLAWSSGGEFVAYLCGNPSTSGDRLYLANAQGQQVLEASAWTFQWSPDGTRIGVAESQGAAQSPSKVGVIQVSSGEYVALAENALLLDWLGNETVLLGVNVQPGDLDYTFDTYQFPASGGPGQPFDGFTSTSDFWPSPDGLSAIVLGDWVEEQIGFRMFVYDIEAGDSTEIPDSAIGYGSEYIPDTLLAFSPEGSEIFWINGNDPDETPLLHSDLTVPSPATPLGGNESVFGVVSPRGNVAYVEDGLVISDPANGEKFSIADANVASGSAIAWRTP